MGAGTAAGGFRRRKHHSGHKRGECHVARSSCRCNCEQRRKPPSGRPDKCGASLCCCGHLSRLGIASSPAGEDKADDTWSSSPSVVSIQQADELPRAEHHRALVAGETERGDDGGRRRVMAVVVAVEKESYDPRRELLESMMEVIRSNGMEEARELRSLLGCYMSMNSEEHRVLILEAFHDTCAALFPHSHYR